VAGLEELGVDVQMTNNIVTLIILRVMGRSLGQP